MPFDSVRTVTPTSGICRRPVTRPGAGGDVTSSRPASPSVHGTTVAANAAAIAVFSVSSVGSVAPGFDGATPRTTRLSSRTRRRIRSVTSAAVTPGTNVRAS